MALNQIKLDDVEKNDGQNVDVNVTTESETNKCVKNDVKDNIDELLPEVSPEVQTDDEDEDYEDEKKPPRNVQVSKKSNSLLAKTRQVQLGSGLTRQCVNCGTHSTSQWRTNGNGHYLCNACGLYRKYNGEDRPPANTTLQRKRNCSVPKKCSNCGTLTSSMWRRTANKQVACNACGLYYKLYGVNRPIEMRKDIVYPRNRYSKLVTVAVPCRNHKQTDDISVYNNNKTRSKQKRKGKNNGFKIKLEEDQDQQTINDRNDSVGIEKIDDVTFTYEKDEFDSIDDNHKEAVARECANCGATSTSHWRRLSGNYYGHYLCNPCGIYKKVKGEDRPLDYSSRKINRQVQCANCGVTNSSEWRRNNCGQTVCNACGLYYKLHSVNRPINMRRDFIVHRNRMPGNHTVTKQSSSSITASEIDDCKNNSDSNPMMEISTAKKRKQSHPKKIILS